MKVMFRGGTVEDPSEAAFVAWMAGDFRPLVRVLLIAGSVGLFLSIVVVLVAIVTGSAGDMPYVLYLIARMAGAAAFLWLTLVLWRRLPEVERRHSEIAWGTERPDPFDGALILIPFSI